MKRVEILSHRFQDENYNFQTWFEWNGSKYGVALCTPRFTGLVINRNKQWKLKIIDHDYFMDTDLLIRGDVLFGLWWRVYKLEYFLDNVMYRKIKYSTLKFLMFKPFHLGYAQEGAVIRWRDLFKRKPK